jgi:hypothetical protein
VPSYLFTWRKELGAPITVEDWLPVDPLKAKAVEQRLLGENPSGHELSAFQLRCRFNPDRPAALVHTESEMTPEELAQFLNGMGEDRAAEWLHEARWS